MDDTCVVHRHIGRQCSIQRPKEVPFRVRPVQVNCRDLSQRVNASIRAPGHQDRSPGPSQLAQSLFKFALNRSFFCLSLASVKIRAIVGKSQLVTCHCRERQLPFITILFFYEFQNYHFSRVAHPGSELHDTSVSAVASCKPGSDFVKQTLDHLVIAKLGYHQTACIHLLHIIARGAIACNCDKVLCLATDRVGLGTRGLDALVYKKLLDKVPTESNTRTARPSKSVT